MIAQVECTAGNPVHLNGYAYDYGRAISAVQFSLNEGRTWTTYDTPGTNDHQTLRWSFDYTPRRPGVYRMRVRSVNDHGEPGPEHATVTIVAR